MSFAEHPHVPEGAFIGPVAYGHPDHKVIFGDNPNEYVDIAEEGEPPTQEDIDRAVQDLIDGEGVKRIGGPAVAGEGTVRRVVEPCPRPEVMRPSSQFSSGGSNTFGFPIKEERHIEPGVSMRAYDSRRR